MEQAAWVERAGPRRDAVQHRRSPGQDGSDRHQQQQTHPLPQGGPASWEPEAPARAVLAGASGSPTEHLQPAISALGLLTDTIEIRIRANIDPSVADRGAGVEDAVVAREVE